MLKSILVKYFYQYHFLAIYDDVCEALLFYRELENQELVIQGEIRLMKWFQSCILPGE